MELKFKSAKIIQDGGYWLCLRVENVAQARTFIDNLTDRLYVAALKVFRQKRSLDANAYAWLLMNKIAVALETDKDEIYLQMLEKYGVFTHLIVKEKAVDRVMQAWRICRNLGQVTVNGNTGIQLQCYYGSSTYDTKEMSVLINGIVYECKQMGIETATPEELSRMCGEWGR